MVQRLCNCAQALFSVVCLQCEVPKAKSVTVGLCSVKRYIAFMQWSVCISINTISILSPIVYFYHSSVGLGVRGYIRPNLECHCRQASHHPSHPPSLFYRPFFSIFRKQVFYAIERRWVIFLPFSISGDGCLFLHLVAL